MKWGFGMAQTNVSYHQAVRTQDILFQFSEIEADAQMQARKEFGEAIKSIQEQSIINGTSKMTLDEINDIISECRQEAKNK